MAQDDEMKGMASYPLDVSKLLSLEEKALVLKGTEAFVREYFLKNNYDPSHDFHHVDRVRNNALFLARELQHQSPGLVIDLFIVEMAALLHDIGDTKYHPNEPDAARHHISSFLKPHLHKAPALVDGLIQIVENISFRKELARIAAGLEPINWVELAVVQDADRLDAIGAFGIARCFSFGASRGSAYYTKPDIQLPPPHEATSEQLRTILEDNKGSTLEHFYGLFFTCFNLQRGSMVLDKLFKLKDMMKTSVGRQEAERRHEFMSNFVREVDRELNIVQP